MSEPLEWIDGPIGTPLPYQTPAPPDPDAFDIDALAQSVDWPDREACDECGRDHLAESIIERLLRDVPGVGDQLGAIAAELASEERVRIAKAQAEQAERNAAAWAALSPSERRFHESMRQRFADHIVRTMTAAASIPGHIPYSRITDIDPR